MNLYNQYFNIYAIVLIFGFAGIITLRYNKMFKKIIDDYQNEKKNLKLIKESKKQGYKILIETILEYIEETKEPEFEDFLKKKWNQDYIILQKSKDDDDDGHNRNYSEWKNLFQKILIIRKNLKNF